MNQTIYFESKQHERVYKVCTKFSTSNSDIIEITKYKKAGYEWKPEDKASADDVWYSYALQKEEQVTLNHDDANNILIALQKILFL